MSSSKKTLAKVGVIFCSFTDAVQKHPDLIEKAYLGSVVPANDNFFRRVEFGGYFSDGSFLLHPRRAFVCPMELSTSFPHQYREHWGKFERTLIIAEEGAYVALSRGLPLRRVRDENQLHAAVVGSSVRSAKNPEDQKYSTVPELVSGRPGRQGRHPQCSSPSAASASANIPEFRGHAGRDGLGHHVEISERAVAKR